MSSGLGDHDGGGRGCTRISIRCTACRDHPGRGPAGLCSVCRGSVIEWLTTAEIEERLVERPGKFLYVGIPIRDERHLGEVTRLLGLQMQAPPGSPSGFSSSDEVEKSTRPAPSPRPAPPMYEPSRSLLAEAHATLARQAVDEAAWIARRPPFLVGAAGSIVFRAPGASSEVVIPGEPACAWNPWRSRPAAAGDLAHARAEVAVGTGRRRIELCAACAAMPAFRRRVQERKAAL